ncbi:putative transporter [Cladorrhinum sp. PSN259]|nr:putative transporter [Cladorrhinum sp. PSN259]
MPDAETEKSAPTAAVPAAGTWPSNGRTSTSPASTIRVDNISKNEINPNQHQHQPASSTSLSKDEIQEFSSRDPDHPAPTTTATAPAAAQAPPEESRTRTQTALIIAALGSALFLAALDVTIVTVAIPTIAQEFNSTAGYTWIGSAYMLGSAGGAPIWGKISDIWGRKQVMLIAVAVFWVGSLLSAVSKNMGMLIAARAIQGIGGGGVIILVNVCISDLFSMRKRGVYFGVMGIVWAIAGAIGPVLGGVFTSKVTWRWCFYVNLPISGLGFAVLAFVLRLHNPRTPMRQGLAAVDWLGSVTVIGATLMILFGLEFGGVTYPWSSATVICLIIFGAITTGLFVLIEWKVAKFPLMPLRLFKSRSSVASFGVAAFQAIVFISGSYYLPLYFQAVLGASPLMSGVYILPFVLSLSVVSAITGGIIKKTGRYLECIVGGMAIMTIGFGLFINLEPKANWPKIIIYQIIAGVGVGPNFQAPLIALQSTVEGRDMAVATATFGFVRQLFTAISVVIGGVVFQNSMQDQYPQLLAELGPEAADLLSGRNAASSVGMVQQLPEQDQDVAHYAYYKSLRTMYIMYVAFAAVGTLVSLLVGSRTLSKDHQEHKTGLQQMKADQARRSTKPPADAVDTTTDEEKGQAPPPPQPKGKKTKMTFFLE